MGCAVDIRGLYLAALVHHDGRILVTGDDIVPMIDVDSEFSSASLSADLYWLMKVFCISEIIYNQWHVCG